jgi:hypothetical protein
MPYTEPPRIYATRDLHLELRVQFGRGNGKWSCTRDAGADARIHRSRAAGTGALLRNRAPG